MTDSTSPKELIIIGLMSGTSADGIDAAIVAISGAPPTHRVRLIRHETYPHDADLRRAIFAAFRPESSSVDHLTALNTAVGAAFAEAALRVIAAEGMTPDQVDLIASHGQVVWYAPPGVMQLGEPAEIVERTGITTISGFRSRDLAAGGRGAPLVSYLDWLLLRHPTKTRALQNIGGIGNITALPPRDAPSDQAPLTFDTGPGNMIIDYCVQQATGGTQIYDEGGKMAAAGQIHPDLFEEFMETPYLTQPPPKTTGRELFGVQFGAQLYARGRALGASPQSIVTTATAITVESIAWAITRLIPYPIDELYIAGGGAFNATILDMLRRRLPGVQVGLHDSLGIPAAAKEAVLFALLGYETWHGRPGTLPVFTGARHPAILGNITPGRRWPPGTG
jgi:anhydro-N-acetylmuramic acid kinase